MIVWIDRNIHVYGKLLIELYDLDEKEFLFLNTYPSSLYEIPANTKLIISNYCLYEASPLSTHPKMISFHSFFYESRKALPTVPFILFTGKLNINTESLGQFSNFKYILKSENGMKLMARIISTQLKKSTNQ